MKKLNNKGFAISTLLYGILTIVIMILMLLLNIMRSSYNKEKAAVDDISYYMNKCVSRQVSLEKCYKKYNSNPSNHYDCSEEYNYYTACLGLSTDIGVNSSNVALLNRILVDDADNNSGLIVDTTVTNGTRYIFTGENPKNYIRFGTKEGRIISIETDGTIKVLLTSDLITSELDKKTVGSNTTGLNTTNRWTSSTLYNTLKIKYNSMEYTSRLATGKFYTGAIYDGYSTKEALDTIHQEYVESRFGLPTLEDYLKASANIISSTSSNKCDLTSTTIPITTSMDNCHYNNWLTNGQTGYFWTLNAYGGLDSYVTYSTTGAIKANVTTKDYNSYMVILLKDNTMVGITGTGSKDSPYIVELR